MCLDKPLFAKTFLYLIVFIHQTDLEISFFTQEYVLGFSFFLFEKTVVIDRFQ